MNNVLKVRGYSTRYYIFHPWVFAKHCARNLHWAWDRITKGYCDYDVWDLNSFFFESLAPAIERLNEIKHGTPPNMSEKEWTEKLNHIVECFRIAADEDADPLWQDYLDDTDTSEERRQACLQADKWHALERDAAKNEALDLIKEYFWDLWD